MLAGAWFPASGELLIAILKTYLFQCLPIKMHGSRGPATTRLKPWDHTFIMYERAGATKGKSAAHKIYDKIEDKLQDKIQDKI